MREIAFMGLLCLTGTSGFCILTQSQLANGFDSVAPFVLGVLLLASFSRLRLGANV